MNTTTSSTDYGPSNLKIKKIFDEKQENYELWDSKFLGYIRLQKLHKVLQGD